MDKTEYVLVYHLSPVKKMSLDITYSEHCAKKKKASPLSHAAITPYFLLWISALL